MADPSKIYGNELEQMLGTGPFGMNPAETKFGAAGQGILSGIEAVGDFGNSVLEFPGYLGGEILDYLTSPTEFGQAKNAQEQAALEAANIMTQVESGDPLAAIKSEFGPLGEFGGMETGVDTDVDEIATTLAALDITPSTLKGGRGTMVEKPGDRAAALSETAVTQAQADEGFLAAMDDFFESARGAGPEMPKERTIEEYKKVFSEATGIDTSGKVDKKDALMAFGLALMQNKAGKGFNVGKMLQSVGEAGDKAMPALQRAKSLAREGALAGGKYALQSQAADKATRAANQEKMMNRSQYWVYERGEPGAEFAGFDKGQLVPLSKYELNKLIMDPEFEKRYEFISAADRMDVLAKRAEGQDLGDQWGSKFEPVSLIGGKWEDQPAALVVSGVAANPNYKGTTATKYRLGEDAGEVVNRFIGYQEGINKDQATFKTLIKNIEAGVSIPGQAIDKVTGFFRAIGYTPPGGMPSNTAQAKQALANFSIDNATDILKESGKTLSDGDRKLVSERVGKIDFFNNDPVLILNQVQDIYDFTVTKAQKNLDTAIGSLEKNFGISISSGQNSDMPTQAELDAMNKANGTNLTMADFK